MVDVKKVNLYVSGRLGNWVTSEIPESPSFPDIEYVAGVSGKRGPVRFRELSTDLNPFSTDFLLDPFDIFRNDIIEGLEPFQETRCRIYIPFSRLYEFEMHVEPQAGLVSGTGDLAPDLAFRLYISLLYYSPFNLDFGEERVPIDTAAENDGFYFNKIRSCAYFKFQRYFYAGDYLELDVYYLPEPNRYTFSSPRATIILKELEDI